MTTLVSKMAETNVEKMKRESKPSFEMKQRAVKYYNENGIPKCLESLLNSMFIEDPDDIYGYMAEFFSSHSKHSTVSKIKIENSISSRGFNSINGDVFCIINGIEKFVTSLQGFFDDGPTIEIPKARSKPATGLKGKADKKAAAPQSAMHLNQNNGSQKKANQFDFPQTQDEINGIALKLHGQKVGDQKEMDEHIKLLHTDILTEKENEESEEETKEDANKEGDTLHSLCLDCQRKTMISQAELYLSLLVAKLISELTKCPLYQSINNTYGNEEIRDFTMPIPLVSLMKCGTESPGKLNMMKAVYLAPKPGWSYLESFQKLSAVHRELAQSLQQKFGMNAKLTSQDGSYLPNMERPEQVFEFVQQACNLAGVDFEQDISLVIDVGASHFYDEDKKKYEVSTGSHKTAEDLIAIYTDFVERYPLIGIIDAISFKDAESCDCLAKNLSEKCFIFGDAMFNDKVDDMEDRIEEQICSGAVLRLGSYFNSLTELFQSASFLKDAGSGIILSNQTQQGCECALIPDMAVAVGCSFISFGAVTNHDSIQAFNRLNEIEKELRQLRKLNSIESHSFPVYKETMVEEEEQAVEEDEQQ